MAGLAIVACPVPAAAQVAVEFFMGNAFSARTPLTFVQAGQPDIAFTADYETRPLHPRQYYAWRLGWWNETGGWVLEHLHHKVYLQNVTEEVRSFEVSHGYNIVSLNRAWRVGAAGMLMVGGGAVVSYPHSEVRGQVYSQDSPYHLSGVGFQGAAARRFDLTRRLFIRGEAKVTAAYARVPIVDGHAKVPNVALHVLAGAGWEF